MVSFDTGTIEYRFGTGMIYQTRFSHDGTTLAVVGDDLLGTIDLAKVEPSVERFSGGTNPLGGNILDICLRWTKDDRRPVVAKTLRPIQVFDLATHSLTAEAMVFEDGGWLALRSDGAVDGSVKRTAQARLIKGGKWVGASHHTSFFLNLLP